MKFVDEATIHVQAGKGGDGSCSFRREKYIPRGGPDGGDGGAGGSIYIEAVEGLSTLVDYRYARRFKAQNGEPGKGKQCTGRAGDDLTLEVPIGTQIFDQDTRECLGDLSQHGERILIAKGGVRGLGNINFKSSVNQAPTRTTKGTPGEERNLLLELKLLADVGLLGLPNAGKSTFIRAISAAKPRVADYPFTTLYPNLGVVKVEAGKSFVVADIPGLLEGASEGVGLGVQFLKHLSRTSVLLHILDVAPMDGSSPVEQAKSIIKELEAYSPDLAAKPRWLILNKIDLIDADELQRISEEIIQGLDWDGPVYKVSAISGENTRQICYDLMESLSKHDSE